MATHTSTLAWRIPGTGEPGGLPSMGRHRVGHDWSDLAPAAAAGKHSTGQLTSQLYSLLNMNGSSRIIYMETMTMWKRVTKTNRWEMTPEEMDGQFWRKKIIFKTWTQVIKSLERIFIHKMRYNEKWEKMKQTKKILGINKCLPNKSKERLEKKVKKSFQKFF